MTHPQFHVTKCVNTKKEIVSVFHISGNYYICKKLCCCNTCIIVRACVTLNKSLSFYEISMDKNKAFFLPVETY